MGPYSRPASSGAFPYTMSTSSRYTSGQCVCNSKTWRMSTRSALISVPSFGPMALQPGIGAIDYACVLAFQYPHSGQCVCNLTNPNFGRDFTEFQSPHSGQCVCNKIENAIEQSPDKFQSPHLGQCVCNSHDGNLSGIDFQISVPSFGPMCLQPRRNG